MEENESVEQNELYVEDNENLEMDNQETQAQQNNEESEVSGENVDTTDTEPQEQPKMYTKEEVDKMIENRVIRENKQHKKEMLKYKKLENTLRQGLGKNNGEDIDNITNSLDEFYKDQGIEINHDVSYRDDEEEKILGQADARNIIELGEEEMNSVVSELANKKRTAREDETLKIIYNELTIRKAKSELAEQGADSSIIESDKFKKFAGRYAANVPLIEIYNDYKKINGIQKQQPKTPGSMKGSNKNAVEVKDFYTKEEAEKFTVEDFDRNPKLWKAIEDSASKWK